MQENVKNWQNHVVGRCFQHKTKLRGKHPYFVHLHQTFIKDSIKIKGFEAGGDSVPSHVKGLANSNVQSASFKMLQRALEMDLDLSHLHGSAKAPRDSVEHG